ncbi:type IV toxin-antitoxin system AbiEi family antitoxin domain-containing protein [Nocardioides speluncae]|uniref:type IV toxin-antitoxin system AbiEi family antitoxin domain-containing protein n=1 Tax=Nocardioides speluncae TaxID=2670337 RepID=UPI00137A6DF2|nr:type IV toxin-antitoxin system AbiEi family antitoxin domain-containing protein [Nocardioides speluncae]
MDSLLRGICESEGVFLRREAESFGYHDREMARLVRSGVWHRVRRGAYTFRDSWDQLNPHGQHLLLARAVLRTANTPVCLSHASSAIALGADIWDIPLDEVHLTRHDGKCGRREAGVRQHRGVVLPEDLKVSGAVPHMSATRTALEVTTIADVEHSLVVVNSLLHRKLTTQEALAERYQLMQFWPATLATDLVLRLCDDRIESPGESRSAYLFFRGGIPRPKPQYDVFDELGEFVGRVDFAWPDLGAFIEFDGKAKYTKFVREGETPGDVVLRERQREVRICEVTGWRCLRLTWADLARPAITAARIRAFLGLDGRVRPGT